MALPRLAADEAFLAVRALVLPSKFRRKLVRDFVTFEDFRVAEVAATFWNEI